MITIHIEPAIVSPLQSQGEKDAGVPETNEKPIEKHQRSPG
jgi:hypothetical protein